MIGDWMGSQYGIGSDRIDYRLLLEHDSRYEWTVRHGADSEQKQQGSWSYDQGTLCFDPDAPGANGGDSSRWWVLKVSTCEESNCILVLKRSEMASTKLIRLAAQVTALDAAKRRWFYESLALNLTIVVRIIWSDEQIVDAEKIHRMKMVNEIQHRIIGALLAPCLRPDIDIFEDALWLLVKECPGIAGDVGWAVTTSIALATERP